MGGKQSAAGGWRRRWLGEGGILVGDPRGFYLVGEMTFLLGHPSRAILCRHRRWRGRSSRKQERIM